MADFSEFKNRKWYHQRFDGSPMFLAMIGTAETLKEPRKPEGLEAGQRVCFFENGGADWFLDQADIDRGASLMMQMSESDDNLAQGLMSKWSEDEKKFEDYFQTFVPEKLRELSDSELVNEFNNYTQLARARFTSSSIIDHFALGTDFIIADMIRKELGSFKSESEFTSIFSTLTSPVHQSFINQAEIDLLKIVIKVKELGGLGNSVVEQAITRHQKKYFWIQNNYIKSKIISVEEFTEEVNLWIKSGKDIDQELELIRNVPVKNRVAKEKILPRLSSKLQRLLKISEAFTFWQDERKKATFLSTYLGDQILAEMAQRRGFDKKLLKFLLPSEVQGWFQAGSISVTELVEREKRCAVILEDGQESAYIKDDDTKLKEILMGAGESDEIRDIRGLVASTGRAIGTAKIILSVEDIGRVNEGDILIAVMTRPDYTPAMKKAGAIVTDEGGITSHAAIVSRELGKPCIIGTKIATKVFKDGDKVEVNANHNWIRKIN